MMEVLQTSGHGDERCALMREGAARSKVQRRSDGRACPGIRRRVEASRQHRVGRSAATWGSRKACPPRSAFLALPHRAGDRSVSRPLSACIAPMTVGRVARSRVRATSNVGQARTGFPGGPARPLPRFTSPPTEEPHCPGRRAVAFAFAARGRAIVGADLLAAQPASAVRQVPPAGSGSLGLGDAAQQIAAGALPGADLVKEELRLTADDLPDPGATLGGAQLEARVGATRRRRCRPPNDAAADVRHERLSFTAGPALEGAPRARSESRQSPL